MTDETMMTLLRSMTDETDEDVLSAFLELAGDTVLHRTYPCVKDYTDLPVPEDYKSVQLRIAAYFLNKRGADGENVHLENGTHRHYEAADVPPSLLSEIIPFAGVPK